MTDPTTISPFERVGQAAKQLQETGRYVAQAFSQSFWLMVGLPSYEAYVEHRQQTHPDEPVMSYEAFFKERQEARYGGRGKGGGCC